MLLVPVLVLVLLLVFLLLLVLVLLFLLLLLLVLGHVWMGFCVDLWRLAASAASDADYVRSGEGAAGSRRQVRRSHAAPLVWRATAAGAPFLGVGCARKLLPPLTQASPPFLPNSHFTKAKAGWRGCCAFSVQRSEDSRTPSKAT